MVDVGTALARLADRYSDANEDTYELGVELGNAVSDADRGQWSIVRETLTSALETAEGYELAQTVKEIEAILTSIEGMSDEPLPESANLRSDFFED